MAPIKTKNSCKKPLRIMLTPKSKVEVCAGDEVKAKVARKRKKVEEKT